MKGWMKGGMVLALALSAAAWAGHGGKISWQKDYAKAREQAKKEGKLLVLYFTAEW